MNPWTRLAGLALLALPLVLAQPRAGLAQDAGQFAGQWGCRYSMEPFNGQALDKHYWEYTIALAPNGTYQMQGFYYNPVVGQIPVQGDGRWGLTNSGPRGLAVQGKGRLFRQDSGWGPFTFVVTPTNAQNLYLQFRGNTHFTNISCQR